MRPSAISFWATGGSCSRHGRFQPGRLRSDAPPEAYLVQEISRQLHEEYREPGDREGLFRDGLSFRKVAKPCGITERALYDVWYGNSWPRLRTIARLEMIIGKELWDSHHIARYEQLLNE